MIYICVPTYNEAPTVGVLLWKIRRVMAEFPRDYQILVVDDASTDATPEVLEPYARVLPLTVIHQPERRGYAASLERLLREAVRRSSYPRRDVVVTLQADFTEDPQEIPTLVKAIEGGADAVTTSVSARTVGPASVRWGRRAFGWLLRRYEWPKPVTDPASGFRAYRLICVKKALQQNDDGPLLDAAGWMTNAMLLRAVSPHCRRVEETAVTLRYQHRHRPSRFRLREAASAFIRFARSRGAASGAGSGPEVARDRPADGSTDSGPGNASRRAGDARSAQKGGRRGAASSGRSRTGRRPTAAGAAARRNAGREGTDEASRTGGPGRGSGRRGSSRGRGRPQKSRRDGNGDADAPADSRNVPEREGES